MKVLRKDEIVPWLQARTLPADISSAAFPYRSTYLLRDETGLKTCLARYLANDLSSDAESFVWLTDWGIFPSCENMSLFESFRESVGEKRPLDEAPFHVFSPNDVGLLENLLGITLYFFWDATALNVSRRFGVRLSHDEWIELFARTAEDLEILKSGILQLELKPTT